MSIRPRIPIPIWLYAAAVTCIQIGGTWDISWHLSIGRDEFLTPPHLLIYFAGVLAALASAMLVFRPMLPGIGVMGFTAPLGAFLAAWGGATMLVSAPFDDWWHSAYGLDVKVLSPPHVVLLLGVLAVEVGAQLVTLAELNRRPSRTLQWIFLWTAMILCRSVAGSMIELMSRNLLHTARYYLLWSFILGVAVAAMATASRHRWGATIITALLMAVACVFLWVLPWFPAEPKLGPVYQPVTHFIPPAGFPALVIVPGVILDLVRRRLPGPWQTALVGGPLMLAAFLAVQWPFADFLLSPGGRNAVFGSHYFPYFLPPSSDIARYLHSSIETNRQFWLRLALAFGGSILFLRAGLASGAWMRTIRR